MTRLVAPGIALGSDAAWYLTVPVTCPKCGTIFYLTPEDFQTAAGPFGSSDTIWHWWRQLQEGDPTTALLDLSNYHLDPAQVSGPCPNCNYQIAVQGPRYGTTKIQDITTDPDEGDIPNYIALGATSMAWYALDEHGHAATDVVGLFIAFDGTVINETQDVNGTSESAPGVARDLMTNEINTNYVMVFVVPNHRTTTDDARRLDNDLVDMVARMGLEV